MALVVRIPVGRMENLVYLIADERTKRAVVVDSGWETEPIVSAAREGGMHVLYAIATHGHFDHTQTIHRLADSLGAKVVAHEKSAIDCDVRVRDGDVLPAGGTTFRVVYTPGHTEDSICIYDGQGLFTGDTLFIGAWGRTDLPGGSDEKMYESMQVIKRFPDATVIYPGHDYGEVPNRALGEERISNGALLAKSAKEFSSL